MKNKTTILIAEDHHLVAKLLSLNLEAIDEFRVLGVTYDGRETIKQTKDLNPDVLLLDIDMPVIDGMQVLKEIREQNKNIKIIMVSNHTESWLIKMSLLNGADGYITKFAESEELIEAVYAVTSGRRYLCNLSRRHLQFDAETDEGQKPVGTDSFTARYQRLTKREKEIFKLVVNGASSKDIAEKLYISVRTAETHRKNILKKMEMKNSVEMIKEALASGIFQGE